MKLGRWCPSDFLALDDFEPAARRKLPKSVFEYIAGGAERKTTLRRNKESFLEWDLVPRVLVDTSARVQSVNLFGHTYDHPFGISPMGGQGIAAFEADISLATAACEKNIPMVLSAFSVVPMEEVAQRGGAKWFQAYIPSDRSVISALIERVARASYKVLVVTVDVPVAANRENDARNGYGYPIRPHLRLGWQGITHPSWLLGGFLKTVMRRGSPRLENMSAQRGPSLFFDPLTRERRDSLSWEDIKWIRGKWKGALVLKGVLSPEDAKIARMLGIDGIVVSNHGGRQLDGVVSSLDALPDVVRAAGDMTVMLDGGITRGTDVLKALSLGAKFVFAARPFAYAAVVGNTDGVIRAIDLLAQEVDRDLALLGTTDVAQLNQDVLKRRPSYQ